jgi:hypothetical protein
VSKPRTNQNPPRSDPPAEKIPQIAKFLIATTLRLESPVTHTKQTTGAFLIATNGTLFRPRRALFCKSRLPRASRIERPQTSRSLPKRANRALGMVFNRNAQSASEERIRPVSPSSCGAPSVPEWEELRAMGTEAQAIGTRGKNFAQCRPRQTGPSHLVLCNEMFSGRQSTGAGTQNAGRFMVFIQGAR